MVKKGTQICDPLGNKCPWGHDSVSKTSEIYLTKRHLFSERSQFCFKLLGGRNFDHVYQP